MFIERYYTKEGEDVFESAGWEKRTARITGASGEVIFEQEVEVPVFWSQQATNIVAQKYFYGDASKGKHPSEGGRESSVRQLIDRVCASIAMEGSLQGLLDETETHILYDELCWMCIHQYGSFNSPVWFNVGLNSSYSLTGDESNRTYGWEPSFINRQIERYEGVMKVDPYEHPQASACFILSLEDSIDDIWRLMADSARLFKYGSGIGSDWSRLRSTKDKLSGGGVPSGPVSFMKVQDTTGGTIKSGGKTRRAAIMQTLKVWHPDIELFVGAKQAEEKKAWALIEGGYDASYNGDAYGSVAFQNVNQSVRVTDKFMQLAVRSDFPVPPFDLRSPSTGEVLGAVGARQLLLQIAEGTYVCGDPGLQYEDTIQKWHTCKASGPINSSNPCSEYMFLDDTACNLASLNLKKFWDKEEEFDTKGFQHATRIFITAMEILIDMAGYPTEKVAQNSHDYRPLGLGFANLGALLMAMGLPYDSDEGRSVAASIMALEHSEAYCQSARIAERIGPFNGYKKNRDSMLDVIERHKKAAWSDRARVGSSASNIWEAATMAADVMASLGLAYGFRNSQVTVLAPTGTIAFMMDCDTTGIEPAIGLVTYKLLAGKGDARIKMVNHTVEEALVALGYRDNGPSDEIAKILEYIEKEETIVGCSYLKEEHLPVFATSFGTENAIPWHAHIKMMGAVQPFVSGAISKTINMPESSTVDDIALAYVLGWRLGLKAVAIYRENSKRSQPLSVKSKVNSSEERPEISSLEDVTADVAIEVLKQYVDDDMLSPESIIAHFAEAPLPNMDVARLNPVRRHLPDERESVTHKFTIAGQEGYLTVGLYPDTRMPGEIFIRISKQGSTISGVMDAFATMASISLQYGVPLEKIVEKFKNMRFEPSGFTHNKRVPVAKSILDYIARYLEASFLEPVGEEEAAALPEEEAVAEKERKVEEPPLAKRSFEGPPCSECGSLTQPAGKCYVCHECGTTTGCG